MYLDDLVIFTPKGVENSEQVHLNVLEYLLWSSAKLGFKIGKGKFKIFKKCFQFLGHFFSTETSSTGIPPEKIKAFGLLRAPRSSAEAISRLGALNYFSPYVPLLRVVSKPIQDMTCSGTFNCTSLHQQCWETLKMLCVLTFQTHVIIYS